MARKLSTHFNSIRFRDQRQVSWLDFEFKLSTSVHPDGWVGGPLVGRELGEVVELFLELIAQKKSADLDPRIDPKLWRTKQNSGQTNGSKKVFGNYLVLILATGWYELSARKVVTGDELKFVLVGSYNAKTLRHDLKYLELNRKCIDVKEKSNRVIKSFDFESKTF